MALFATKSWHLMFLPGGDAEELTSFPFLIGASPQCDLVVGSDEIPEPQILIVNESRGHLSITSRDGTIVVGRQAAHFARISRKQGKGRIVCGSLTMLFIYTTATGLSELKQRLGLAESEQTVGGDLPVAHPVPASDREPGDDRWLYRHDGQVFGPMSTEEITNAVQMDLVWPDDDVWLEADPETVCPAYDVEGIEFPKWHYEQSGQIHGPVDRQALGLLARQGQLARTDLLCAEGSDRRFPAETLPGLIFPDVRGFGSSYVDIQGNLICPYCWGNFAPEHILYIAAHPELRGDPVLGPSEFIRFAPTIITPEGHAKDPKGMEARHIACPHCHMQLPFNIADSELVIYSMAGTVAAGKTVYLASLLNVMDLDLNHMLPFHFTDVDTQVNLQLKTYAQKLLAGEPVDRTGLADHAVEIVKNDFTLHLPLPYMFNLEAAGALNGQGRHLLVLYDNAGEHWLTGNDRPDHPGTGHVSLSDGMLFVFDPTRDVGIRRALEESGMFFESGEVDNQREILMEMIHRFRTRLGLMGADLYENPLIVCIAKSDLLGDFFDLQTPPWTINESTGNLVLNVARLVRMSYRARGFLMKQRGPSRNLVLDAERFASNVLYLPISAFGVSPQIRFDADGKRCFHVEDAIPAPGQIAPKWVEAPILYLLSRKGYVETTYDDVQACVEGEVVSQRGRELRVRVAGIDGIVTVPEAYSGYALEDFASGVTFQIPATEHQLH